MMVEMWRNRKRNVYASIHVGCTLVEICKLIGLIGKEKIRPLPFSGK
jgi:hypothetical protein